MIPRPPSLRIQAGRFLRARKGASAVEFALLAPLLLGLIFSCIEAGWMMVRYAMLDQAVNRVVRDIRLQPDSATYTQETLRAAICEEAMIFADCTNTLLIEMVPVDRASDVPSYNARCVNRTTGIDPAYSYQPGSRSEIVYMRNCIVVDPLTPMLGFAMSLPRDDSGGHNLVVSTAFMNEPS